MDPNMVLAESNQGRTPYSPAMNKQQGGSIPAGAGVPDAQQWMNQEES
jgi:hypothetical protein